MWPANHPLHNSITCRHEAQKHLVLGRCTALWRSVCWAISQWGNLQHYNKNRSKYFSTVQHHSALLSIVQHRSVPFRTVQNHSAPFRTIKHRSEPFSTSTPFAAAVRTQTFCFPRNKQKSNYWLAYWRGCWWRWWWLQRDEANCIFHFCIIVKTAWLVPCKL